MYGFRLSGGWQRGFDRERLALPFLCLGAPERGSQYTSDDFRDELAKHGIECSMSSTGNCYDNAALESFFGLLKRERVNRVR